MRRMAFLLWTAAVTSGCTDHSGPSGTTSTYALARVGPNHLPVLISEGSPQLLLADTFRLMRDRSRTNLETLRQTTVIQNGPGGSTEKSETEFEYRLEAGTLVLNNCPIGALCAMGLVYAPRIFQIEGDSLFELTPLGANLPSHVYGLVRHP
jgi:hypothetical protein